VPGFPLLKCGAVTQYPSDRVTRFSTEVRRFIDGTEQRFPQYGARLRRWVLRMDLLDEAELGAVEGFFEIQTGRAGQFEFTDPWDSVVYANCSFDSDSMVAEYGDVGRGKAVVVIRENR